MDDATRADSVPFDAMKVMLAFQRLKRQTHGAGLCRRGAARHGARLRPVTSMISRSRVGSGWRAHRNESAPRLPPATSTGRHLAPESARHLSGSRRCGEIAVSSSAAQSNRRRSQGACRTKRVSAACPVPRTSTASAWIVREHVTHSLKTVQTRKTVTVCINQLLDSTLL